MGDFAPPDHRKDPLLAAFWIIIGIVLLFSAITWPFHTLWRRARS